MMRYIKSMNVLAISIMMATLLTGCITRTSGMETGVSPMQRTLPERLVDKGIEHNVRQNLETLGLTNKNSRIAIDSFFGNVLLTGEVPSESVRQEVEKMVGSIKEVSYVYNALVVSDAPKTASYTLQENYLKTKLSSKILSSHDVKSSQVKVVVRSGVAYILGKMLPTQREKVIDMAKDTSGVLSITSLIMLVDENGNELSSKDVMTNGNSEDRSLSYTKPVGENNNTNGSLQEIER